MIFFKKDKKIKQGDVYAVQTGDFVGQMFYYIKDDDDNYVFVSAPEMKIQKVPKDKFEFAKQHGIIEYVENLPRNIFKVVKKQYEVLEKEERGNT
jgi:ribosomal protein L14E/L6E/L27E